MELKAPSHILWLVLFLFRSQTTAAMRALVLCGFVLFIAGCKKPIENPETLDPIFSDLISQTKTADAAIEEEKKTIETLKKDLAALPPRDITRRHVTGQIYAHERLLVQARQRSMYYKKRAEQRKRHVAKEYMAAFNADRKWPDPEEIKKYKSVRTIATASRNWEDRVPKTDRYNKKVPGAAPLPPEGGKKEETKPAH